ISNAGAAHNGLDGVVAKAPLQTTEIAGLSGRTVPADQRAAKVHGWVGRRQRDGQRHRQRHRHRHQRQRRRRSKRPGRLQRPLNSARPHEKLGPHQRRRDRSWRDLRRRLFADNCCAVAGHLTADAAALAAAAAAVVAVWGARGGGGGGGEAVLCREPPLNSALTSSQLCSSSLLGSGSVNVRCLRQALKFAASGWRNSATLADSKSSGRWQWKMNLFGEKNSRHWLHITHLRAVIGGRRGRSGSPRKERTRRSASRRVIVPQRLALAGMALARRRLSNWRGVHWTQSDASVVNVVVGVAGEQLGGDLGQAEPLLAVKAQRRQRHAVQQHLRGVRRQYRVSEKQYRVSEEQYRVSEDRYMMSDQYMTPKDTDCQKSHRKPVKQQTADIGRWPRWVAELLSGNATAMRHPGKAHIFHSDDSASGGSSGGVFSRFFRRLPLPPARCLAVATGLVSLLAIVFICLFAVAIRRGADNGSLELTDICLTEPDCLSVAAAAARRMNTSSEPCSDFYSFACGGDGTAGNVPAEMELGARRKLASSLRSGGGGGGGNPAWERKLRRFYARCEENFDTPSYIGDNPLLAAMRAAGVGEFLLNQSSSAAGGLGGFSRTFQAVSGRFYAHSLFATRAVYSDFLHRRGSDRRYAIWVGMNSRSDAMYVRHEKELYRSLIKDVAGMLVRDAAMTNQTARVETFANDVLYVEEQLLLTHEAVLQHASLPEQPADHPANLAKISDLTDRISSHIDFRAYLAEIYQPGLVIRNDTQVLVTDWYYVDQLRDLLDSMRRGSPTDFNRKMNNYLTWTLIAFFQWDLSGEYRLRFAAYRRIVWPSNGLTIGIGGGSVGDDAATDCLETVRWGMNQALSALFVRNNFEPGAKARAGALFEKMRRAAKDSINRLVWMDNETKRRAKQRLADMVEKTGYPDEAWDDSYLDAEFRQIDPSTHSYFSLIVSCINYWKTRQARLLTQTYNPLDFQHWGQLWEPGLRYLAYDRELLAQAGALQVPLFPSAGLPQLLAYSGAASMMAHEILQSFDITSHAYEAQRTSGWWSDATISEYRKRTACIMDLFKARQFIMVLNKDLPTLQPSAALSIPYQSERNQHQRLLLSNWTAREMAAVSSARAQFDAHRLQGGRPDKRLPLLHLTEDQMFYVFYMQKFCHKRGASGLAVRRASRGADWRRGLGGKFHDSDGFKHSDGDDALLILSRALANTVLSNAPGFAKAFGCPAGNVHSCSLY
uniref:Peptidase_M13_N domain-containing protein n=1 Tax=Macrostomum lignano TaxID=282301 RepID=A0A1I8HVQ0_9PLAT